MINPVYHRSIQHFALFLTCAAALGGCSSSTQGEKMVQSFSKTRQTLADARNEVAITLVSMNRLRDVTGDDALKRAFTQYKEAVARLEKQAGEAKTRAAAMKEETDQHVQKWQK